MVGAAATPGQGCSGRFWVMRNKRDYLWSAATRRRFFYDATCHLVPKRGHVRAPQSLDNAASHRIRKSEAYATLCSASVEVKISGEAVRFPTWDADSVPYRRPTATRL